MPPLSCLDNNLILYCKEDLLYVLVYRFKPGNCNRYIIVLELKIVVINISKCKINEVERHLIHILHLTWKANLEESKDYLIKHKVQICFFKINK